MNDMQKGVIMLVKSAITQEALPLPEGFSIAEAYDFIIKHKIMMLAYDGAVRCGISKEKPAMQKLFKLYINGMMQSERQMKAVEEIYSAFDANEIDYLPLKGCNMKALYPKPELRVMGDADILTREDQYEKIRRILKELRFWEGEHYRHQYVWKSPELYLEIHNMPVQEDYERFYSYYGNGWSRALKTGSNRYDYSEEDNFIYTMVHFAKHYLAGGIGIRHAADVFVYLRTFPEMDFGYIENEFEKLGIAEFYKNVIGLMEFWFKNGKADESVETISEFILQSGNWGTIESAAVAAEANEKGKQEKSEFIKAKFILREIFPPLGEMKKRFPVLEKLPFLVLAAWPVRWIESLLFRRKNILKKIRCAGALDDEKVDAHRKNLERAGFRF